MDFASEHFARPGDADFTAFPKHLPEDCVSYSVYVFPAFSKDLSTGFSSTGIGSSVVPRLKSIIAASTKLTSTLLKSYIWQREAFSLSISIPDSPSSTATKSTTPYLEGRTEFGDSIADEWLIVYLLREMSTQFPDAWIRVTDADGEFPLIEAANVLPNWLTPEVAENRVWLHAGKLVIIPREMGEGGRQIARPMTLDKAIQFLRTREKELVYSPIIEAEALYRLKGYPGKIEESMHTARVTIPRKLAYVLHRAPAHISAAVDAFYLRDPISLKPLQAKSKARLKFPPEDLVTVSVEFTRVGYAQLKSQEFAAPVSWVSVMPRSGKENDRNRAEMGMKVACGFEMLVADPQNKDKRSVREIELLLSDLDSGDDELPPDKEISGWPQQEDDEKWLNVNFEDFEKELSGRKGANGAKEKTAGFGDKGAQDNLRRIVERFEQFLNDDSADAEGINLDDDTDNDNNDLDDDDDDDDDNDDDSEEDREASFDEEEFQNMMKQMMGLTAGEVLMPQRASGSRENKKVARPDALSTPSRFEELDSSDDEGEDSEDIQEIIKRMESELNEFGALDLDTVPSGQQPRLDSESQDSGADYDEEEEDPKYVLAKNLLESLKGQGGMSGPAGNLMNSFGFNLPRNEED